MRNCAACIWRARDCSSRFCPLPRCLYEDREPLWKALARRMKAHRKEKKLQAMAREMLAPRRAPALPWVQRREI